MTKPPIELTPHEAALYFAFGYLATILDGHGIIPAETFAVDLQRAAAKSAPEVAKPLLMALADDILKAR
jgi:hypothetical protein